MKNNKSFFSWQGNNLNWFPETRWIVLIIIAILLLFIFIFKKNIKRFFTKQGKILIWKNMDSFLSFVGWTLFLFQFFKLILYIVGGYPLYWEHLMLHICRLHMFIISVLLISKKKEFIKYITYVSTMGALGAIIFGQLNMPDIGTNKKALFNSHNINFYSVGADNMFFYDFFVFHILIIIIPILLWTGYSWKIEIKHFYKTIMIYLIGVIFIWSFNILTSLFPIEWQANNWYIGPNNHNDYNDILIPFSKWPYNIISAIFGFVLSSYIGHGIWLLQFKNKKSAYKKFINDHKEIKNIFKK